MEDFLQFQHPLVGLRHICREGMAEWSMAAVLKTVRGVTSL
jgi:hypothetical protein